MNTIILCEDCFIQIPKSILSNMVPRNKIYTEQRVCHICGEYSEQSYSYYMDGTLFEKDIIKVLKLLHEIDSNPNKIRGFKEIIERLIFEKGI